MTLDQKRFIDRIWKRIHRNNLSCKCNGCKKVEEEWLIIADENHAKYLYTVYCDYNAEWTHLDYYDSNVDIDMETSYIFWLCQAFSSSPDTPEQYEHTRKCIKEKLLSIRYKKRDRDYVLKWRKENYIFVNTSPWFDADRERQQTIKVICEFLKDHWLLK